MRDCDLIIRLHKPEDDVPRAELCERIFGPGRFAKTAYRIREGAPLVPELSFAAWQNTRLAGTVSFTEIRIGGKEGALLLGPLVVDREFARKGCGIKLIDKGLEKAKALGYKLVILVGDLPYYNKVGFEAVPLGKIELPGPVDPARILALELESGALLKYQGKVQTTN